MSVVQEERVEIIVAGRVQGVGYRYSARRFAMALGLTGYVRNLVDGAVQIEAQGDPSSVEQMVRWCRQGPSRAEVLSVEIRRLPPEPGSAFEIRPNI